jgi:Phage capsid family
VNAPSQLDLSAIGRLSADQKHSAITERRNYLSALMRDYPLDSDRVMPVDTITSMARANLELDSLMQSLETSSARDNLSRLDQPAEGGWSPSLLPGGAGRSGKNWAVKPGILKRNYWTEPFLKATDHGEKALTTGTVMLPSLLGGYAPILDRPLYLAQAIPSVNLDTGNQYVYWQESTRTLAAAEVAAGAVKPTSTLTMAAVTDNVRTIATVSQPVNRFDLEDATLLQQYLETSLAKAVALRLDGQILNGNGTPPNLQGLMSVSNIHATIGYSTNILTTARKAITAQNHDNQIYGGMLFVVSPSHWEAIELLQLSSGGYLMQGGGAPVDTAQQRMWGVQVMVTDALSGANALLFVPGYCQLVERGGIRLDWSDAPVGSSANNSAFLTNEVLARVEGRWGLSIEKPASVIPWATA